MKKVCFVMSLLLCFCLVGESGATMVNVALTGTATGNNYYPQYGAGNAIDDNTGTIFGTLSSGGWWNLDLNAAYNLDYIEMLVQFHNQDRAIGSTLKVFEADGTTQIGNTYTVSTLQYVHTLDNGGAGYANARYIRIEQPLPNYLVLTEVRAFVPEPATISVLGFGALMMLRRRKK